ncbi:hypothetical protein Rhe02_34530 [Rhizocola hellebori]|uniref:Secreted protein n=1 Tax=Rhizocola hellebori TaxID=1392758 RepID=A0A8J3Q7Q1_9ACTN|nr:hypothetical protein [Rhizocola hellebori]GIH05386.1 hypothetical protein Rhe02_34530 [Rhizocola hellebori]
MKAYRKAGGLVLGLSALLFTLTPATVSAAGTDGHNRGAQATNAPTTISAPGAVAPDSCLHIQQLNPDEQKYRTVSNIPFTYTDAAFGVNVWFDVACGDLFFTVPPGRQALVDLTAVAELDCQGPAGGGGWCGGRFLINGLPLPWPDNTGRPDSYAWDSAIGGAVDWQANTLAQEYVARCDNQTAPCGYKVQLQSALLSGSTSVWIDDLTTRVDVTIGPVSVV